MSNLIALREYAQHTVQMQAIFRTSGYGLFMTIESDHGKRLKAFRQAVGLSQRELAQRVGVIHSNINYWENSGKLPKSELLIPISKALGVTVDELLGEPKPSRARVPGGKLGEVFNEASRLPRRQQQKIAEVVEGMLLLHETKIS